LAQFTLPPVYPILDTATLDRLGLDCLTAAEAVIEGGARILQIRHKGFWSRETVALAGRIDALCQAAGILFVVNDRADYAAVLGAALHVGQEDLSPADARRVIGSASILGYSTHSPEQVIEAEGWGSTSGYAYRSLTVAAQNLGGWYGGGGRDAGGDVREGGEARIDYLAFGPVFPTVSKERPDPTVGIAGLKAIRALTKKPLVAIGGITRDNAFTCWNAGADSVAIIADLYPTPCTKISLRDRMTEWQNLTAS